MASFGLEPFDDDDAIDWAFSLARGDWGNVEQALNEQQNERLRWAALGLVAAIINHEVNLPDGLEEWRTDHLKLPDPILFLAQSILDGTNKQVQSKLEPNNSIHEVAIDEWALINETIRNPKQFKNKRPVKETPVLSPFVCAHCNKAIATNELIELSLSKGRGPNMMLHSHEACLAESFYGDLGLLLKSL